MIIVNVIRKGGIKQFSDFLEKRLTEYKKISFVQYDGLFSVIKMLKKDRNITFTCNTKEVYFFVLLSYFYKFKLNLILHDHKVRNGASIREKLLVLLYFIFKDRFSNVIVHSKSANTGVYMKMPFHQETEVHYKLKLLQFGRLEEYKNIDYLVRLISKIDSISLVIAGSGQLSNETLKLINESKNISLINQYIDVNLLQWLILSSDGITLVYNDITQTGLIDYALKNRKVIILSDIDEFDSLPDSEVIQHIPINDMGLSINKLRAYAERFDEIKKYKGDAFLKYEPDSIGDWNVYVKKVVSFME